MRIKILFTPSTELVPINNQSELNSYIHKCIGNNNYFHDSFSDYSISSLQGGRLVDKKRGLVQYDNPHFFVTGEQMEDNPRPMSLLTTIMTSVMGNPNFINGMKFLNIEFGDFIVNKHCDTIQTISPILLYDKNIGRNITFKDDNFLKLLIENSKNKLNKISELNKEDIDSLKISFKRIDNAKIKHIKVKNVINTSSLVRLRVEGNPRVRKILYTMGLGKSTGSGFGAIKILGNEKSY